MTLRRFGWALLVILLSPGLALSQEPPPQQPAGVIPPDQNLPPHIRRLSGFGERAEFSIDGRKVIFLTKTYGDVMEADLETGLIRNLTSFYPHYGYVRALYLANGDILLAGPTEYDLTNPGAGRNNSYLFILKPGTTTRPYPLGVKAAEGPVPSRTRMHVAWSNRAIQYPDLRLFMPAGSSVMYEADIVYNAEGVPSLANQRKILSSTDLPFAATVEPQNYRRPNEQELTFSAYDYGSTEVFGIDLPTGRLTNYSNAPDIYDEPEGIFPDGLYTTVESDHHMPEATGFDHADIYKLRLDGSGTMQRLTYFSDVPTYRASNPVVSDDGRYMAFQMGRTGVAAGTGYGIFLFDLQAAARAGIVR